MEPIETLASDILKGKCCPQARNLGDLGLYSATELSMLCLQVQEEENVLIHTSELSSNTELATLRQMVQERRVGNYWSRGGSLPELQLFNRRPLGLHSL